jgi:hypothetical protein
VLVLRNAQLRLAVSGGSDGFVLKLIAKQNKFTFDLSLDNFSSDFNTISLMAFVSRYIALLAAIILNK